MTKQRYEMRDPYEAGLELAIRMVPINVGEFMRRSSFLTLARLVREGYVRIDKDLMVQFPEDDDE